MVKCYCCNLISSTAVALDGTTALNITIPAATYNNGQKIGVRIVQGIPSTGTPVPVNIVIGATAYPLLKPCGNFVMSDQLRSGVTYCLRVGTNPEHFTVTTLDRLCGTTFVAPQLIGA